jgi:hypothetical protein
MMRITALAALLGVGAAPFAASAGEADVLNATAQKQADGSYPIAATVRHDDTGWEHYADAFEVSLPDGTVLGTRVLYHPHETEQPFTRSLSGVQVPAGATVLIVRAHDKAHGFGGKAFRLTLR